MTMQILLIVLLSFVANLIGTVSGGHVNLRIALEHTQNGPRKLTVGQDPKKNQVVVEAAIGDHYSLPVECVRLARFAHPSELKDLREFPLGAQLQRQSSHNLE